MDGTVIKGCAVRERETRNGGRLERSNRAGVALLQDERLARGSTGAEHHVTRGGYLRFLLDLRALRLCFFPGGPPGLPEGVLASPGFFCFPMTAS